MTEVFAEIVAIRTIVARILGREAAQSDDARRFLDNERDKAFGDLDRATIAAAGDDEATLIRQQAEVAIRKTFDGITVVPKP